MFFFNIFVKTAHFEGQRAASSWIGQAESGKISLALGSWRRLSLQQRLTHSISLITKQLTDSIENTETSLQENKKKTFLVELKPDHSKQCLLKKVFNGRIYFCTNKRSLFQFATGGNCDFLCRWSTFCATFFHLPHNIGAGDNVAEDDVLAIEPISSGEKRMPNQCETFNECSVMKKLTMTYLVVVMKNCDPFEFGPELAIDSDPKLPCFSMKFSSANFLP